LLISLSSPDAASYELFSLPKINPKYWRERLRRRPTCRLFKLDHEGAQFEGLDWSHLAQWLVLLNTVEGKAIPVQVWTGSESSRRLRLPHFKTFGTWRW